jgi:chitinase
VATASSRQLFADNIHAVYTSFNLDGIDIDWEYPGQDGNKGNQVNSGDTANYLQFLQLLRSTLPSSAMITAAVQPETFADSNGRPMKEISDFAKLLDWVLIMNYDVWGCKCFFFWS